ncbi:Uncharacterised protein [Vibrio cholerae]|nr:Uncharacterised protein [Vibrio cholerae]CSC41401.1 Uncharacterised protein [Vibrio cholerae]CSC72964.1 Uncharacterised protein [Vibrio cholerae]
MSNRARIEGAFCFGIADQVVGLQILLEALTRDLVATDASYVSVIKLTIELGVAQLLAQLPFWVECPSNA